MDIITLKSILNTLKKYVSGKVNPAEDDVYSKGYKAGYLQAIADVIANINDNFGEY